MGVKLLAKLGVQAAIEAERADGERTQRIGHDIHDLRFIADLIKASERKFVIEDFHYMSVDERRKFAFDLKALWDYGLFVAADHCFGNVGILQALVLGALDSLGITKHHTTNVASMNSPHSRRRQCTTPSS
jgi:hypothetical protein